MANGEKAQELLRAIADAWRVQGREPVYHRRQQARLQLEWNPLARAVQNAVDYVEELERGHHA